MQLYKNNFQRAFTFKYSLIVCIYFLLGLFGILRHEMWLDEMHHFLLARDSVSLGDLYNNSRYDGHPLFWNILLMIITKFTHNPFHMQVLHILISTAAVIIFLRNSPFTDVFKILFVFSYFIFYEYSIISRNYAISVLFLFIPVSFLCSTRRHYPAIVISLLLLSYTHLFSLICAASLFIITIILYYSDPDKENSGVKFRFLCLLFVVGFALIVSSIIPPSDHLLQQYNTDSYFSYKRIGRAFSIFFKGLFHIPDFLKYHFWNTNLLVDILKNFSIIPSLVCFIFPVILFYDKPIPLIVFYLSSILIAVFIFWSPIIAGVRYYGYIFLLLIVSLWLEKHTPPHNLFFPKKISIMFSKFNSRFKIPVIYTVMFIQVISGGIAYSLDIMRPFSEGKNVAEFICKNGLEEKIIAVSSQNGGPTLSGYLIKKVYYPEINQFGSFCKWNKTSLPINKTNIITGLNKLHSNDFILVVNDSLFPAGARPGAPVFANDRMIFFYLSKFDEAIVRNENYWIYEVKKINEK